MAVKNKTNRLTVGTILCGVGLLVAAASLQAGGGLSSLSTDSDSSSRYIAANVSKQDSPAVSMTATVISADSVHLVQVERLDKDGQVAGEAMSSLVFYRSLGVDGLPISSSGMVAPAGQALDNVVLSSTSKDDLLVHLLVDGHLREIRVAPGEGLAFGEPESALFAGVQHKCVCYCIFHNSTEFEEVSWICQEIGTQPCDCSTFNGQFCNNGSHEGQFSGCKYVVVFGPED